MATAYAWEAARSTREEQDVAEPLTTFILPALVGRLAVGVAQFARRIRAP